MAAGYGFPWPPVPVWFSPPTLLAGGLSLLQLAPDGVSPGPLAQGRSGIVGGPFEPTSSTIILWLLSRGHRVLGLGWDWRQDLLSIGQVVWAAWRARIGMTPFSIVAHSAGGLVARAVYGAMLAAGQGGQLAKLITIGCPHFGSWQPVLGWFRSHPLYRALRTVCGWAHAPRGGQAWLDATIATWPLLYQLMPWAQAGPLFQTNPQLAALLYQPSFYAGGNAYLSPAWLARAIAVQAQLGAWLPVAVTTSIVGVGHPTISGVKPGGSPTGPSTDFLYDDGDGTVTVPEASPPGVPIIAVPVDHAFQGLDARVLVPVAQLLGS